jgi:clan AA aspartic protease
MIVGTVNTRKEAVVKITVRDQAERDHDIDAIVDTGFNGSLTLPPSLIATLGFSWRMRGSAIVATGKVEYFDVYDAVVVWEGAARPTVVEAANTKPLLGMALMLNHDLRIRVKVCGSVEIEPVS